MVTGGGGHIGGAMSEALAELGAAIAIVDLSEEALIPNAKLYEDLDLDSLDAIDLAVKLKNDMGVTLNEEEMRSLIEFSDLIDLMDKKLNTSSSDVT